MNGEGGSVDGGGRESRLKWDGVWWITTWLLILLFLVSLYYYVRTVWWKGMLTVYEELTSLAKRNYEIRGMVRSTKIWIYKNLASPSNEKEETYLRPLDKYRVRSDASLQKTWRIKLPTFPSLEQSNIFLTTRWLQKHIGNARTHVFQRTNCKWRNGKNFYTLIFFWPHNIIFRHKSIRKCFWDSCNIIRIFPNSLRFNRY